MSNPYWIHALLQRSWFVYKMTLCGESATWLGRWRLIGRYLRRQILTIQPFTVHDTARHAIHISETIATGIKTISMMMSEHDQFLADRENADRSSKKTGRRI
jgi:hypothetical protein